MAAKGKTRLINSPGTLAELDAQLEKRTAERDDARRVTSGWRGLRGRTTRYVSNGAQAGPQPQPAPNHDCRKKKGRAGAREAPALPCLAAHPRRLRVCCLDRDVGRREAVEGERVREEIQRDGPRPDRGRPVRIRADLRRRKW